MSVTLIPSRRGRMCVGWRRHFIFRSAIGIDVKDAYAYWWIWRIPCKV